MDDMLLLDDPPGLRPVPPGTRILARLRGASLDALLAAGRTPESAGLLAARARAIVTPRGRRLVAASYAHLLRVAHRAEPYPAARSAAARAVPVCADRVLAAEPAVRDLIGLLTANAPVPARGVAMARVLLTDATSPVYWRRSPVSLAAALDEAAAKLDPALPLLPA